MKLTFWEKQQRKIAESVLAMPDAIAHVASIITKKQAKEMLEKLALKEMKEESEKI